MPPSPPPVSEAEPRLASVWRIALSLEPSQRTPEETLRQAAKSDQPASLARPLVVGELLIEVDVAAGRFVQRLRDPLTHDVLRQYPSEAQLEFSRGVNAYQRAVRENIG